ncbi:MAG: YraN family protein [Thermodesulfobacteriota bacterium]
MTTERLTLGKRGEEVAADLLKMAGYRVIERNFRCRGGEVDIVALDGKTIVFVEVKTRRSKEFGPPKLAVDGRKQRQLVKAALTYLKEKRLLNTAARFDVVGIVVRDDGHEVEHIKNAFDLVE